MSNPGANDSIGGWRVIAMVCGLCSLVACGGGGDGGGAAEPRATVTRVSAASPRYGQTLQFTVEGSSLDSTLVAASPACAAAPVRSVNSTATVAVYTCTAAATGDSIFSVTDPRQTGALGSLAFAVPQPQVTMAVSNGAGVSGNLVFTLDPNRAKVTVDNFLQYVADGFYTGTVVHRVVPGFVVQGGGYLAITPGVTPTAKPTRAAIALEVGRGLSNTIYSIAMARGAAANSATSQFFVNLADNSGSLDPSAATAGYAVFGVLSTGQAVLAAIVAAPCAPFSPYSECAPNPNVAITAAAQSR